MLLWGLMSVMLLTLFATVPGAGWRRTWNASPQLRLVALLAVLAVVTVPLGIWMSGSLNFLFSRFSIAVAVYIACIFLLRDRKVLRRVVALFILITAVVATRNLIGYFNHDLNNTMMSDEEKATYLDDRR